MGNAHAIAAKRLPSVVPQQQTAPHSLSRTSTTATASNSGIFGAGAFVNGISHAAAALRASLGGGPVDAALSLDHEDILRVESASVENSELQSDSSTLSEASVGPSSPLTPFGAENASALFADRVWLPRLVRREPYINDLHIDTANVSKLPLNVHAAAACESIGFDAQLNAYEPMIETGNSGRAPKPLGDADSFISRKRTEKDESSARQINIFSRDQKFAVDASVTEFLSHNAASTTSATLNQVIPGIGIVVFVGALIFSVVPVQHAAAINEALLHSLE